MHPPFVKDPLLDASVGCSSQIKIQTDPVTLVDPGSNAQKWWRVFVSQLIRLIIAFLTFLRRYSELRHPSYIHTEVRKVMS